MGGDDDGERRVRRGDGALPRPPVMVMIAVLRSRWVLLLVDVGGGRDVIVSLLGWWCIDLYSERSGADGWVWNDR